MKNLKTYILFFLCALLVQTLAKAQDSHFSQYEYSPLTLNPALTSIDKKLIVVLHHKDQWKALNGFRTDEVSFEMRFKPSGWTKVENKTSQFKKSENKGLAFGINFFSDKAGDGNMKNISGNLSLAYHLLLNENNRLSLGIEGGVKQSSINPTGLRYNSQYGPNGVYDPTLNSGEVYKTNKLTGGDFSAGACYSFGMEDKYMESNDNKSFKIGASLSHISSAKQTYIVEQNYVSYFKYVMHAQATYGIKNTAYSIKASIISTFQGKQNELTPGVFVKYKMKDASKYTGIKKEMAISFGCYSRFRDALIPSLQYEMARGAVGISYDINTSRLRNATSGIGGLEVTLRFFNPISSLGIGNQNASFK